MPNRSPLGHDILACGKAKVPLRKPFTMQLAGAASETRQPIVSGVGNGYAHRGVSSACTKEELCRKARYLHGLRRFDKVPWQGMECFIFGRRTSGCFDLKQLDGAKMTASAKASTRALLESAKTFLIERTVAPPCGKTTGCSRPETS